VRRKWGIGGFLRGRFGGALEGKMGASSFEVGEMARDWDSRCELGWRHIY
jgi:hypothetical protein